MTRKKKINRDSFESVLERFGANPSRWPEQERAAYLALIERDSKARAMMAEYAGFDRLLDGYQGEAVAGARSRSENLADRIMADVQAHVNPGSRTVGDDHGQTKIVRRTSSRPVWLGLQGNFAAASALAASLVLGIAMGSSGVLDASLSPVSQTLGLGSFATDTVAQSDLNFDDFDDATFDEEIL